MEDARSLLLLVRSGAAAAALRSLLDAFGSAEAALAAGVAGWRHYGLGAAAIGALRAPDQARLQADLAWLGLPRHHLLGWHSPDYPALLRSGAHPPAALFVVGDPSLLWHPQVAVVGSRRPSAGGRDNARQFARAFGRAGLAVTSGLAEGIDSAAHLGALETSRTVAVIGTGPDRCYPAGNVDLMQRIADHGAVVSEHPPGTAGIRQHFPSRNRLIAGLSLGTLVVEAAVRSGALITARLAVEAGREVFALPGSIHNPMARGCHRLIRQGAGLAETPEEVIAALAPLAITLSEALRGRLAEAAAGSVSGVGASFGNQGSELVGDPEELLLWRSLGHDPVNLDQLAERTGLTVGPLSAMLLAMELDGKISAEHGRYSRRS
jgi:DNA processing protein